MNDTNNTGVEEISQDSLFNIQIMSSKRKGGGRKERDNKKEISEGTKRGKKVDGEGGISHKK